MSFVNPKQPNLADFSTFVYDQGVPTDDLPNGSDYIEWALDASLGICLVAPPAMPGILYSLAVYNLGMHTLIKIAQDQPGLTFFRDARNNFKFRSFTAGPVVSSSDQSTSESLLAPDFLKGLTLQDLDLLKTPWGREYLMYAQAYGPNVVGVS